MPEICADCEKVFYPKTNKARLCPACIKARLSKSAKERNLNRIGLEARTRQRKERYG